MSYHSPVRRLSLLVVLSTFVAPFASAQEIQLTVEAQSFTTVFSAVMDGAPSGPFSGWLSLNGSRSEIPVTGSALSSLKRVQITVKVKYAAVPEDWLNRFRRSDFDYRLRGQIAGARNIDWAGSKFYSEVQAETRENGGSDFVKLSSIVLTQATPTEIAAHAQVSIQNPLSFPLKLASTSYRLSVKGREVGSGATQSVALVPAQNTLDLPINLDHGKLLAAAGSALRSGGVQARLEGTLVIRLPGGDISIPLDLSGKFALK